MSHHKSLSSFEDEPNHKNNEQHSYRMSSGRGKDFPKLSSEIKEEEEGGGDDHFKVPRKLKFKTLDIFCL
jgi:hypothetical protein